MKVMTHSKSRLTFRMSLGALVLLLIVGLRARATMNINTEALTKACVFFYNSNAEGGPDENSPLGTGFVIYVPSTDLNVHYMFLVTARHIADPGWANCVGPFQTKIWARLNKKNYDPKKDESGVVWKQFSRNAADKQVWSFPSEDDADVAIAGLKEEDIKDTDVNSLPFRELATPQEAAQHGPTEQVISAGLFVPYAGVKRNYPIIRFGYVSSKPDEEVPSACAERGAPKPKKVWLLYMNMPPGTSGSPIYYAPEGANGVSIGGGRPVLLGVQSSSSVPFDVATMAPAEYIYEAIQALHIPGADLYRGVPKQNPSR
jgi:hypothetical protein